MQPRRGAAGKKRLEGAEKTGENGQMGEKVQRKEGRREDWKGGKMGWNQRGDKRSKEMRGRKRGKDDRKRDRGQES